MNQTTIQSEQMARFLAGCRFKVKGDTWNREYTYQPEPAEPVGILGKVLRANGSLHCYVSELWSDENRLLFHSDILTSPVSFELPIDGIEIL